MRYLLNYLMLENVGKAKQLLNKLNIDENSKEFLQIRQLLNGHDGYVFWFTNQHFVNKISIDELKDIWKEISTNKSVMSNFKKNIVNMKTIEEFWDEFDIAKTYSEAKSIYNEFPSKQKSLVDLENKEEVETLKRLYDDKNKDIVIKKISLFKNKSELFSAINRLINFKSNSSFEGALNSVKRTGAEIVYSNALESIIICRVNYNQIDSLGSDTAWCIVRSEGTFNSYNSAALSSQYVILLTDETGNKSKIGLTINAYGYNTAHKKNDEYISLDDLNRLLLTRDFNIENLYPKKSEFNDSVISDVPVKTLMSVGFDKDEIIKRKGVFRGDDLTFFTEEEIEKNGLLDKTQLTIQSLKSYSVDTIIDKRLVYRVSGQLTIDQLTSIGFTIKNLDKVSDKLFDSEKELINKYKSKTKPQIIKIIDSLWTSNEKGNRLKLIGLFDINSTDISLEKMIEYYKTSDTNFKNVADFCIGKGYTIDKIYNALHKNSSLGGLIKSMEYCRFYDELENIIVDKIKTLIEGSEFARWGMSSDYDYSKFKEFKVALANQPELYDTLFKIKKSNLIRNPYSARVKGSYSSVDNDQTIANIKFFNIGKEVGIDGMKSMLDRVSSYKWPNVFKFWDEIGLEYSGKEGFDLVSNLYERDKKLDLFITCIENGVYVEECYDMLDSYVNNMSNKISKSDRDKINKLQKDSDRYIELWEEHDAKDNANHILSTTCRSSKYWSPDRDGDNLSPEKWYETIFNGLTKININKVGGNRESYKTGIGAIVLLAKLGKIEDFDKIKFNFLSSKGDWTFSDGRNSLTDLCKVIANKNITNWDYTWRIYLNPEERKSIYNWLVKYIDENREREGVTQEFIDKQMQVCYYLYDKDKFRKYLDKVKKTKNNVIETYWGKGDVQKERTITNRLHDIRPIITYLAEQSMFDELKDILKEFKELKMGKAELKLAGRVFRANLFFSKSKDAEDKEISSGRLRDTNTKELEKIGKDFLTDLQTNESLILRFNDFNLD